MQFQKNQLKESEIQFTIEITPQEYQPFLEKAAKKLSKEIKIEGFRPGNAPYSVVKQEVGEMKIYEAALEELITHFYWQVVTQEKVNTVGQPKIEIEKLAPGNPLVFKTTTALMPQVKLANYKSVKVKKKQVNIEEKEIAKTIENLRKMQAKETLEDKFIEKGDRTEIDFTVSLNKVVIEHGVGKKYSVVIGDNFMIPGFEDQLLGMKKDKEKEFQLTFPQNYQDKMVAGKNCDFKVKVLAVYKRQLPQVDDEWAKTLGSNNLADLKERIKKNLEDERKFQEEQRTEIEMLQEIVKLCEFSEIPEILIDNEVQRMLYEFEDNISHQGLKFEDYLLSIKKERKDLENEFRPKAKERVQTSLVIREIAETENVSVSEEEVNQEIEKIINQLPDEEAKKNTRSAGYKQYVSNILRNQKVIEKLKKECII
ncbi:trigger factor [Patescibacteria group bacterium]|nr:trigger factor [Patescibacteria group bacterium]